MKKILAMLALTFAFAAIAGSATPQKDLPIPTCLPCSS